MKTKTAQMLPDQTIDTQLAGPAPDPVERTIETEPKSKKHMRVFERRRKEVESSTTPMQNYESNEALGNEVLTGNMVHNPKDASINTKNSDIPIAIRKRVTTCIALIIILRELSPMQN